MKTAAPSLESFRPPGLPEPSLAIGRRPSHRFVRQATSPIFFAHSCSSNRPLLPISCQKVPLIGPCGASSMPFLTAGPPKQSP